MLPQVGSSQQIKLKHLFGINSQLKNNLHFIDQEKILFPAGYHAVIQDLKDNTQSFLSGLVEYTGISCLSLSPQKKKLALGLMGSRMEKDDRVLPPAIEIYDVVTNQRKKPALVYQDVAITKWVSIAFASQMQENKYLVSLSGEGEQVIVYWHWEKGQALCAWPLQKEIKPREIQISYYDPNFITIVGDMVFQCFKKIDSTDDNNKTTSKIDRVQPTLKERPQDLVLDIVCHQWLSCDQSLVACTSDGGIILCKYQNDQVQYKEILKESPNLINQKDKDSSSYITACCAYSKGFIVAAQNLQVFVYKYNNDDVNPFDCVNQIKIKTQGEPIHIQQRITGLAINPNLEDRIIVSLSNNTMYKAELKQQNDFYDMEQPSEQIGLMYHNGPINAMDICIRKPLLATCGQDNTIKIWNYEEKTLELNWVLNTNEEPSALAFHPSGFHLVVALQDKLRLMSINIHQSSKQQMDKNRHYKEISQFKNCKEIKFSNGGQYFAAVNGNMPANVIHIFKFYTGENPPQLIFKAHLQKVRSISWSKDDTVVASCGTDGQVYAWKIDNDLKYDQTGMRVIDAHQKSVQFSSLVMTHGCGGSQNDSEDSRNKKIIVSGNDKKIYEIDMNQQGSTQANMEAHAVDYNIQALAFPSTNKVLFAGIQDVKSSGLIRCYLYPLTSGKCTDYQAHDERGVEKMRVTYDNKWLLSVGKDGCILLFEIKDKDARGQKLSLGYPQPSQEILVTKQDLDDLKHKKEEQLTKLQEVTNSTTNNQKEETDQIKELREQQSQANRQHKVEYENMQEQKKEMEKKYDDDYVKLQDDKNKEMEDLESEMNNQQMQELEKYENAKRLHNLQINKNDTKKQNILLTQGEQAKAEIQAQQNQLEELRNQREKIENDIKKKKRDQEVSLALISQETQREIEELVEKNQKEQQKIAEQTLTAKTEVSFTNKKIEQQQNEQLELEDQRKMYEEEKQSLEEKKKMLNDEINKLKQTILERDKQIGEKEKRIYDLKKRSQELEKFKFVLDHKIKELKRDIAPRQEEIQRMKKDTNELDIKLKDFNKYSNILGSIVDELDQTQQLMQEDISKLRQRIQQQKNKIKNFKNQVYATVQHILDYDKLKESVTNLKDNHAKDFVKNVEIDQNITNEYESQKKYLKKTVNLLKRNLTKDEEIHKQDNIRIIKANVELIRKVNILRAETKNARFNEKTSNSGQQFVSAKERDEIEKRKAVFGNIKQEVDNMAEQLRQLEQEQQQYQYSLQNMQQQQYQQAQQY